MRYWSGNSPSYESSTSFSTFQKPAKLSSSTQKYYHTQEHSKENLNAHKPEDTNLSPHKLASRTSLLSQAKYYHKTTQPTVSTNTTLKIQTCHHAKWPVTHPSSHKQFSLPCPFQHHHHHHHLSPRIISVGPERTHQANAHQTLRQNPSPYLDNPLRSQDYVTAGGQDQVAFISVLTTSGSTTCWAQVDGTLRSWTACREEKWRLERF